MHGNTAAAYVEPDGGEGLGLCPQPKVLDGAIKDGHAVAIDDFLGIGSDQVVVGCRAMHPKDIPGDPGIKLFLPNEDGSEWTRQKLSGAEIAVEDIKAGDLNGDGKPEIVAATRQTKNLTIFFNES